MGRGGLHAGPTTGADGGVCACAPSLVARARALREHRGLAVGRAHTGTGPGDREPRVSTGQEVVNYEKPMDRGACAGPRRFGAGPGGTAGDRR